MANKARPLAVNVSAHAFREIRAGRVTTIGLPLVEIVAISPGGSRVEARAQRATVDNAGNVLVIVGKAKR